MKSKLLSIGIALVIVLSSLTALTSKPSKPDQKKPTVQQEMIVNQNN